MELESGATTSKPSRFVWFALLAGVLLAGCNGLPSRAEPIEVAIQDSERDDWDDLDDLDELDELDEDEDDEEVYDPLSGFNRFMFGFNDKLYFWLLKPVAQGYGFIVPEPARVCVERAFKNLRTPPRFANSLLQLELGKAGAELRRFTVNTTLGFGGLFDAAETMFDWRAPPPEDFGQTLAVHGVGSGVPVTLPVFGPSNVRDALGRIPDVFLDPTFYFLKTWESFALSSGETVNRTSLRIGEYESLKNDALDPYTFFRNAYRDYRRKQIEE